MPDPIPFRPRTPPGEPPAPTRAGRIYPEDHAVIVELEGLPVLVLTAEDAAVWGEALLRYAVDLDDDPNDEDVVHLTRQLLELDATVRSLLTDARRQLTDARQQIADLTTALQAIRDG